MDEATKRFNIELFQSWQAQRKNWRQKKEAEDKLLADCDGMVLSPTSTTKEVMQKSRRRGIVRKAGKLTER